MQRFDRNWQRHDLLWPVRKSLFLSIVFRQGSLLLLSAAKRTTEHATNIKQQYITLIHQAPIGEEEVAVAAAAAGALGKDGGLLEAELPITALVVCEQKRTIWVQVQ